MFRKSSRSKKTFPNGTIQVEDTEVLNKIAYLGLTESDLGRLKGWADQLPAMYEAIAHRFYEAIGSNPNTRSKLGQFSSVEKQKPILINYLRSLFGGRIDSSYIASRRKIGQVHEQIGLENTWYVFQYEHVKTACIETIVAAGCSNEERFEFLESLWRMICFDMSLILDSLNHEQIKKISAIKEAAEGFILDFDKAIGRVAEKDLTSRMSGTYTNEFRATAQTFNSGILHLSEAFSNIVHSVEEQNTTGVQFLATATGEIAQAITEVAANADRAKQTTEKTVQKVEEATQKMASLNEKSGEIGKVTESIEQIADQVNLLALNATIEASRAGESGKGFAVVASEIRALAKQTDDAIEGIRNVIREMQNSSDETMKGINTINEEIGEINEMISNIAAATTQVDATSHELNDYSNELSEKGRILKEDLDQFQLEE